MAKIKGLNKVLKKLRKFGDEAEIVIGQVTEATAKEFVQDARNFAPVDLGKLKQNIKDHKVNDLNYKVSVDGVAQKYAPYVEFGTGAKVNLQYLREAGLPESYAMKFKGNDIKKVNISPQPYFFPAYILAKREYVLDLKQELKILQKKYNG